MQQAEAELLRDAVGYKCYNVYILTYNDSMCTVSSISALFFAAVIVEAMMPYDLAVAQLTCARELITKASTFTKSESKRRFCRNLGGMLMTLDYSALT
jgi:hypothetical protein